jgi:hypothetical protein
MLKETLALLDCKGDESQQLFAESFCAYAYFRIPPFRELILSAVNHNDDPEIPEWRGIDINLYESGKNTEEKGEDFYSIHFDWENNFYKPIA